MPPLYVKPENALKRSEELLALNTSQSQQQAFECLFDVFNSKRFKHTPVNVLEPIVYKFIDLCVAMNRKAYARAALQVYKNAVQQTSTQTVQNVINHFIATAEARLAEAVEQARNEVAALPESPVVDDDLPLQPSALLYDTFLESAGDRDRIERRLIAPAQKMCYDAYDIGLDVTKGNDRLEEIYQDIAHRAFNFCRTHLRKSDFRRLCDQRLRKDLANISKYSHQSHAIDLSDPAVLSRHLDTRFRQLETAVELELWQEAFRSVEDVHGLVAGKQSAKPSMMANYYEKLTQIFGAEGGKQTAVFHAAAWSRYYQYAERVGSVPKKAGGCVLLSALAVPLGEVEAKQRLVTLLNLQAMPTREQLVKDAAEKHLKSVPSEIREIYNSLEINFQPMRACKALAPLIGSLGEEYQAYLPALREVVLSRLLQALSETYDVVSLSHILGLVKPFDGTAWAIDMPALEKYLMIACRRGDVKATVDHIAKAITFAQPPQDINHLSTLAVCLYNAMQYLNTAPVTSRADAYAIAIAAAEEDRKQHQHRRQIVQKRRELMEEAKARREREEATAKAETAKIFAEERARLERERVKQQEKDRLQKQMDDTRREEARKLAQSLGTDIQGLDGDIDTNKVVQLQIEQVAKERREKDEKLRVVGKRVDHLERALRKEERPLLAEDYERQKKEDKIAHERSNAAAKEEAIERQKNELALKSRLSRMMDDYLAARAAVESQQAAEFQRAREAAQKKIASEKEKYRAAVLARRKKEREDRERRQREEEEEERRIRDAEAEKVRLAEEREEAERTAREEIEARLAAEEEKRAKLRADREAERAKAAEQARKQLEREEDAARRAKERAAGTAPPSSSTGGYQPPAARGGPSGPGAGAGGAYTPPGPRSVSSTVPSSRAGAAPSVAPDRTAPPLIVAGGAGDKAGGGGGGWRERLAARQAGGEGGSPPPQAGNPAGAAPNGSARGTSEPPSEGAHQPWRPSRGRGGATGGAPSTRGGAAGGSRW